MSDTGTWDLLRELAPQVLGALRPAVRGFRRRGSTLGRRAADHASEAAAPRRGGWS